MRLVFLGSPDVALKPLETLHREAAQHGHALIAVVSQPARPVGRSQALVDPPVAAYAKQHQIMTLQPESARDPAFIKSFQDLEPDVAITAAYGQILSDAFLQVPKRATINIHPSLLPKYRGAIPVPAALMNGETESGVTILFTVKKLDAGAMILQEKSPIAPDETSGPLTQRLFELGATRLWDALDLLKDPSFIGTPQDERKVTHCTKIDKNDGRINWELAAEEIYNRYRAFEPWPGTFTFLAGRRMVVTEMRPEPSHRTVQQPGEAILDKKNQSILVATGEGSIHLLKLKPAGGKEIHAPALWNGLKDRSRVVFSSEESP